MLNITTIPSYLYKQVHWLTPADEAPTRLQLVSLDPTLRKDQSSIMRRPSLI
jgi:hypothetical protein